MRDDYFYELLRKLRASDFLATTGSFVLSILLIVVGAVITSRLGSRLARRSIESLVARSRLEPTPRSTSRAKTLAGVAASVVRIVVFSLATLMVLDTMRINLGPFLAGASIVGVALGFGAQSLVRDFLSGFFILAEDQYGVGDVITISDTTGTVEEVNLRVTRMRALDGTVWFVPNGEIRKVGNSAKEWSRALVDVVVPPGADIGAVTAAILDEVGGLQDAPEWSDAVLEAPEVLGVEALGVDGATLRVAAKTEPEQRARVARELRARIMARLATDGLLSGRESASSEGGPPPTEPDPSEAAPIEPAPIELATIEPVPERPSSPP